jgi:hypothetical protein
VQYWKLTASIAREGKVIDFYSLMFLLSCHFDVHFASKLIIIIIIVVVVVIVVCCVHIKAYVHRMCCALYPIYVSDKLKEKCRMKYVIENRLNARMAFKDFFPYFSITTLQSCNMQDSFIDLKILRMLWVCVWLHWNDSIWIFLRKSIYFKTQSCT